MFWREIEEELKALSKDYPVVTVVGPRQSGKTTLVRHLFPEKPYFNLEVPEVRELATEDARGFLDQMPDGGVLDEIQRAPHLLSYIQAIVDERRVNGLFFLTGSHQLELHQAVSQSLAGRTALLQLFPMSLTEIARADREMSIDRALLMGGYPRLIRDELDPTKRYRNYLATYLERDLRQLSEVKDLILFQKFMRLCAGRLGQLLNSDGLANEVGVSSHTIRHWISILEASFILFRLPPYHENFGKRVIKSPKLYFTDTGLACYLLGIESVEQLARDPLRGNLIENLALLELIKYRANRGLDPRLTFFRDVGGHEVDFVFQAGHQLIPIEVKAARTFHPDFLKSLRFFQGLVGEERCPRGYLIYTGSQEQAIGPFQLLSLNQMTRLFD